MSENLRGVILRRMPRSLALVMLVCGCKQAAPARADSASANLPAAGSTQTDTAHDGNGGAASTGSSPPPSRALTRVSRVVLRAPRKLVENSGAAMSASQPGILFTINDSGNEPLL